VGGKSPFYRLIAVVEEAKISFCEYGETATMRRAEAQRGGNLGSNGSGRCRGWLLGFVGVDHGGVSYCFRAEATTFKPFEALETDDVFTLVTKVVFVVCRKEGKSPEAFTVNVIVFAVADHVPL